LGRLGDKSLSHLMALFESPLSDTRRSAVYGLAQGLDITKQKLLSRDLDGLKPFLDPQDVISERFAYTAARKLKLTIDELKTSYADLSERFKLKLEWHSS